MKYNNGHNMGPNLSFVILNTEVQTLLKKMAAPICNEKGKISSLYMTVKVPVE